MIYDDRIVFISTPKEPSIFRAFATPKNVTQLELFPEEKREKMHDIFPLKICNKYVMEEPEEWLNVSIEPRLECTKNWEEFRVYMAQKIAIMFGIPPSMLGEK